MFSQGVAAAQGVITNGAAICSKNRADSFRVTFLIASALAALISRTANADQMSLICNGKITLEGHRTVQIENETLIVDYDERTLKPPLYTTLPILRLGDSTIVFGADILQLLLQEDWQQRHLSQ
jgi:hypothetical protein